MQLQHLLATLSLALPAFASADVRQLGCYSAVPSLQDQGDYFYQSQPYCEDLCQKDGFRVAALSGGSQCLCSNKLPSKSAKVDDKKCNIKCAGWPGENCGGSNTYTVIRV